MLGRCRWLASEITHQPSLRGNRQIAARKPCCAIRIVNSDIDITPLLDYSFIRLLKDEASLGF